MAEVLNEAALAAVEMLREAACDDRLSSAKLREWACCALSQAGGARAIGAWDAMELHARVSADLLARGREREKEEHTYEVKLHRLCVGCRKPIHAGALVVVDVDGIGLRHRACR